MAGRHELTLAEWTRIAPLLPARETRGTYYADHALGRSRGGFTTKLHLVTDGHGLPLAVALSAGQAHESVHATRYEKLAIHYLALVQISMIRLLVRRLERPLSHKA